MPEDTLSADVDYSRGDIVRAKLWLYARRTRLWWGAACLLVLIFNPFWPRATDPLTYWRDDTLGFLLFVISVVWPPMGLLLVVRGAQRTHATHDALKTRTTMELDERGITMKARGEHDGEAWDAEQRTQWGQLQALHDMGWAYLFLRSDKRYVLLPKRFLADAAAWRAVLQKSVPAEVRKF